MNRRGVPSLLLLLSAGLSFLLALATNLAADLLPHSLTRNRPVVWGAVGLLLASTAAVEFWQRRSSRRPAQRGRAQARPDSPPATLKNVNLQIGPENRAKQSIWYGPFSPPTRPRPPRDDADG